MQPAERGTPRRLVIHLFDGGERAPRAIQKGFAQFRDQRGIIATLARDAVSAAPGDATTLRLLRRTVGRL